MTYAKLAKLSGVGEGTLSSIGSRSGYGATLRTVDKIRMTLDVPLYDLLEVTDDPEPEPSPKKTKKKKKTTKTKKKKTAKKKK